MAVYATKYGKYSTEEQQEIILKTHKDPEAYLLYRKKWDERFLNRETYGTLLYLLIETTSACNLRCVFCQHSQGGYDVIKPMSDEIFEKIAIQCEEARIPSVALNGNGEPLLDKKIVSRIARISQIPSVYETFMNTNASLMTEEVATGLVFSGLTHLRIGLDAFSAETYNSVRVGSDYHTVMKNINNLLRIKKESGRMLPLIRLSFVRTSKNEHEIDEFLHFWNDKVDYIAIQEYIPTLDSDNEDIVSQNNLRKTQDIDPFCEEPFERLYVRANGDVLPCCQMRAVKSDLVLGNINENTLSKLFNNHKSQRVKQMMLTGAWQSHPLCSECIKTSFGIA